MSELTEEVAVDTAELERQELVEEDRLAIVDFFRRFLHDLRDTMDRQKNHKDTMRSFDVACLAIGFTSVCNASDAITLTKRYGNSVENRETVNAQFNDFIQRLKLPPLPKQRKLTARDNMSRARLDKINACRARIKTIL